MVGDNPSSAEDQQERLKTIGWVVGFVDGEGCFSCPIYQCGKMTLKWQVRPEFAVAQGARVIGTAATDKLELLRELGVAQAIDYTTTRFENVAHDVDVVLATVGGDVIDRSWAVLKPGGILVTPAGQVDADAAAARGVRGTGMMTQPNSAQLTEIAALIDAGKVQSVVSTVLPLAEAARAHELGDRGHARGKIVLRVVEE